MASAMIGSQAGFLRTKNSAQSSGRRAALLPYAVTRGQARPLPVASRRAAPAQTRASPKARLPDLDNLRV
jgi:hypothetical protein